MQFEYQPRGVCASNIRFDLEDGRVKNIVFTGGCNGNLKAIAKLAEGMEAEKLTALLLGNTCGMKGTSCADQLARAVQYAQREGT